MHRGELKQLLYFSPEPARHPTSERGPKLAWRLRVRPAGPEKGSSEQSGSHMLTHANTCYACDCFLCGGLPALGVRRVTQIEGGSTVERTVFSASQPTHTLLTHELRREETHKRRLLRLISARKFAAKTVAEGLGSLISILWL